MVISVKHEMGSRFDGDEFLIDLSRPFEGYEPGDMVITATPFIAMPLALEIAIRTDGGLIFRAWRFVEGTNPYFHLAHPSIDNHFQSTEAQRETVSGLFSGRIRFDGLKLAIGASVQKVCTIDLAGEEARTGKTIYLS